jgi:hypothetical protein
MAMRRHDARHELETRAAAALMAALAEVSTVKVKDIRHESTKTGRESNLTVHVDVFGRRHILACEIHSDGQPQSLIPALEELCTRAEQHNGDAMPIVIAPYLSPEAQALCKESRMSFVDLEGNARLTLGEIFIVKRTLPHRSYHRATTPVVWHPAKREKLAVRSTAAHATAQPAIA